MMTENKGILVNEENQLLCPECGEIYTHLENVEEYKDDDRKCVKLFFSCEFGHEFEIDFHQHEGITFVNGEDF